MKRHLICNIHTITTISHINEPGNNSVIFRIKSHVNINPRFNIQPIQITVANKLIFHITFSCIIFTQPSKTDIYISAINIRTYFIFAIGKNNVIQMKSYTRIGSINYTIISITLSNTIFNYNIINCNIST